MEAAGTVGWLIERERVVCADLEAVLHAEREALETFSSDAVSRCVRRKAALQGELVRLVERRREAVRTLAGELGVAADDGRIVPLLEQLPNRVAAELREAIGGLRQTLLRTRRLQRVNGVLIDESLKLVGELVRVYRQLLPGTRYDGRAVVKPGLTPMGVDERV